MRSQEVDLMLWLVMSRGDAGINIDDRMVNAVMIICSVVVG